MWDTLQKCYMDSSFNIGLLCRAAAHSGGTNPQEKEHLTVQFSDSNGDAIHVEEAIEGRPVRIATVHIYTGR